MVQNPSRLANIPAPHKPASTPNNRIQFSFQTIVLEHVTLQTPDAFHDDLSLWGRQFIYRKKPPTTRPTHQPSYQLICNRSHAQTHRHPFRPHHRRRPHHHRAGLRVRLLRHPGLQGPQGGGLPRRPRELESGHDHDRSRSSPIAPTSNPSLPRPSRRSSSAKRTRCAASGAGRWASSASPTASHARRPDRPQHRDETPSHRGLEKHGIEMIGAKAEAIERGEDRQIFKDLMLTIGLDVPISGTAHNMDEARAVAEKIGRSPHHPPRLHPRRHRRRHRLQPRRIRGDRQARHRPLPVPRSSSRNPSSAGRNTRWRSCATAPTTASSSAPSRTSIPWASTPATPSPSPPSRRSPTRSTRSCATPASP
jgi:hypothetical protein